MQKTMFKTACTFMLVLFVMSVTGAAACSGGSCSATKIDARDDKFTVSCTKKSFNVLSNDKGSGLKVVTTGYITTAKGGKVYMNSNGSFKYVKPVSCSKGSDSFTYKAVDKYKKYDTAKVTMKLVCSGTCSA
ncbi:MAG: Ig-like domain-containing protein [Methanosarcina sp.]|jgi:hypothetical protein